MSQFWVLAVVCVVSASILAVEPTTAPFNDTAADIQQQIDRLPDSEASQAKKIELLRALVATLQRQNADMKYELSMANQANVKTENGSARRDATVITPTDLKAFGAKFEGREVVLKDVEYLIVDKYGVDLIPGVENPRQTHESRAVHVSGSMIYGDISGPAAQAPLGKNSTDDWVDLYIGDDQSQSGNIFAPVDKFGDTIRTWKRGAKICIYGKVIAIQGGFGLICEEIVPSKEITAQPSPAAR